MRTDLSPDTDVSLLPRADLPVIWDAFKAKAEALRATAETLTVNSIVQKDEMALARTTRLTLREIRIAVEKKRVELGESHLKEIKKVNGAATAIKEFIEPLEARLLIQEGFAERHEANRIAELSKSRLAELKSIRVCLYPTDLGTMEQPDYDAYIARLRSEQAEIEAANRLRVEAEKRLAEVRVEAQKRAIELQLELKSESDRIRAEAQAEAQRVAVIRDAQLAEAQAEADRQQADAEQLAQEVYADLKRKNEAEHAIRVIEALRLDKERAIRDADLAEQKRIRDEQFAVLEAELTQERADKQAKADAARKLELAPDAAKLIAYVDAVRSVSIPVLHSKEANTIFNRVAHTIAVACGELRIFCN